MTLIKGYGQLVTALHTAFPDVCYTIQEMIAEGDKVVTTWNVTGTHMGEWLGIKPAGKTLSSSGVSISRISDGKIAEEFAQFDALGQLQQLSPTPSPRKSKPKKKTAAKPKRAKKAKAKATPKAKKRTRR